MDEVQEEEIKEEVVRPRGRVGRRPRRGDDSDEDDDVPYNAEGEDPNRKLSKKEIQKMQKKQEKEQRQEAIRQEREQRE